MNIEKLNQCIIIEIIQYCFVCLELEANYSNLVSPAQRWWVKFKNFQFLQFILNSFYNKLWIFLPKYDSLIYFLILDHLVIFHHVNVYINTFNNYLTCPPFISFIIHQFLSLTLEIWLQKVEILISASNKKIRSIVYLFPI